MELVRGAIIPNRPVRVMMIGAGDGAVCAALSRHGIGVTGIDDRTHAIEAARNAVEARPPKVLPHLVDDIARLPVESDLVDLLLLDRVLERHGNPLRVLLEARRIMAPRGLLLLLTRWRSPEDQIADPRGSSAFTATSLRNFLSGSGCFRSVPFAANPFSHPDREVLLYALRPLERVDHGRSAFDGIGDPTLVV